MHTSMLGTIFATQHHVVPPLTTDQLHPSQRIASVGCLYRIVYKDN